MTGHKRHGYLPNLKLEALQTLYKMIKPYSSELSFTHLKDIFLNRNPEELVDMFEKLIFHGSSGSFDEPELIRHMEKFINDLRVTWPKLSEEQFVFNPRQRRKSYATELTYTIIRAREESHPAMICDIQRFTAAQSSVIFKSSEFISHFSIQLLECLYMFMGQNGFSKKNILLNIGVLIMRCEEETRWWRAVQKRCRTIVGDKPAMNLEEFEKVICLESFMARRIFELTDKDGNGEVDQTELFAVASLLATGDTREKLKFLFAIYDENGDGTLDKAELRTALELCLKGSQLDMENINAEKLADILFEKVKSHQSEEQETNADNNSHCDMERMTFQELDSMLKKNPVLYDNLDLNLVGSSQAQRKTRNTAVKNVRSVVKHAQIYSPLWFWVILMSAITCAVAAERAYQRVKMMKDLNGIPIVVAKTTAQMLNFLYSLLLVYNLKGMITKMKKSVLRHILPLDDVVFLHKVTAIITFIIGVVHTLAHIANMALEYVVDGRVPPFIKLVMPHSMVLWSGVTLTVLMVMFLALTTEKARNKSFSVFYVSHKVMALLWYISLIIHSKHFIYWFIGPAVLFVIEKLHVVYIIVKKKSVIESVSTHENVTILTIKRPEGFDYHPGDYVMVRVPEISRFAWRPFTISSSKHDVLTLHIRKVGWWTGKLYGRVKEAQKTYGRCGGDNSAFLNDVKINIDVELTEADRGDKQEHGEAFHSSAVILRTKSTVGDKINQVQRPVPVTWKVYMNGPFSTPSHDILKTEHAILVAGGIGITPFASILESVVLILRESSKICPCGCEHRVFFGKEAGFRLKRIDLFWLTRSQKSLGWFTEVFKELEEEQLALGLNPPLVNVHLYLTGLHKETDMRGTFLQLALNSAYDQKSVDMLTGLRAQTKHGRPDWTHVLPEVIEDLNHKDDTQSSTEAVRPGLSSEMITSKVYACGPAALCSDLRHHCSKLKIAFKEEVFN